MTVDSCVGKTWTRQAEPHSILLISCTWLLLVFFCVQRPLGLHGHWMFRFLRQMCTIEEPKYIYVSSEGVPFRVASLQPPTVLQDWSCRRPPYWWLTLESAIICDWDRYERGGSQYILFHVVAGHRLDVPAEVPNTWLSRYRLYSTHPPQSASC